MIVKRKKMTLAERLYLPTIIGGFSVSIRHFFRKKITLRYPEEKWTLPQGYRGIPHLVKDQNGRVKCVACQMCEFICPPKAIKVIPPGPDEHPERGEIEKEPAEFQIDMSRCIFCGYCQEICPEEAIFLMNRYSMTTHSRKEMILNKEKLLELGGIREDSVMKWENKHKPRTF